MAAGRALTRLWRDDQLVAEEEQAILRRGYSVTWRARRRYPRALHVEIPIAVTIEVPFLIDDEFHVGADHLEWSHRILGARRAAMEEFSPWKAGPGRVNFSIIPDDFPTNGPHRLVLQSRVRPCGLSSSWEIELPHVPFQFEFDPVLRLDAILNLPDAVRDEAVARAIRLEPMSSSSMSMSDEPTGHLPLGGEWILRNPPRLAVTTPLPCDLAHAILIEFDGTPGHFPGRPLIVSGQGVPPLNPEAAETIVRRFDLGPVPPLPDGVIERRESAGYDCGSRPIPAWAGPIPMSDPSGPERPKPTGSTSRSSGVEDVRRTEFIPFDWNGMNSVLRIPSTTRNDSGGDAHRGDQAGGIGLAFPGDVEGCAVCDAGPHDRQSQRNVDGPLKADGLQRDMPLVMVHRHDGVIGAGQGVVEEGVIGERPGRVETLALGRDDGGVDEGLLLVAEEPVLAGMRIERRHGDSRRQAAGQGTHRLVGQADLRQDRLLAQQVKHPPQCDVQRHVDHAQARALTAGIGRIGLEVKHHRVIGDAAAFG